MAIIYAICQNMEYACGTTPRPTRDIRKLHFGQFCYFLRVSTSYNVCTIKVHNSQANPQGTVNTPECSPLSGYQISYSIFDRSKSNGVNTDIFVGKLFLKCFPVTPFLPRKKYILKRFLSWMYQRMLNILS